MCNTRLKFDNFFDIFRATCDQLPSANKYSLPERRNRKVFVFSSSPRSQLRRSSSGVLTIRPSTKTNTRENVLAKKTKPRTGYPPTSVSFSSELSSRFCVFTRATFVLVPLHTRFMYLPFSPFYDFRSTSAIRSSALAALTISRWSVDFSCHSLLTLSLQTLSSF